MAGPLPAPQPASPPASLPVRPVPGVASAGRRAQVSAHGAGAVQVPSEHGPLAGLAITPPDAVATVLLLPGFTGSKEDFAPLLDPLADAGYAVLALDLPGQYESDGPDDEAEYLPARLGAVVAGVLPSLGPLPVIVVGHSYGGLVARAMSLSGAGITGVVLLCSGPGALPDGPRRIMLDTSEPVLRNQGVAALQRLREALDSTVRSGTRSPELEALLRERFLRTRSAAFLGMGTALRTEPDLVAELADVLRRDGVHGLVACGQYDDAWPPATQREMALRLGVPFVTVPGAAHSPAVENPDGLLAALLPAVDGWLGRTGQAAPSAGGPADDRHG
jgi:pimeloyl-ACP methyl ester carboxylesterase